VDRAGHDVLGWTSVFLIGRDRGIVSNTPIQCSIVVESKPSALRGLYRQILKAMQGHGFSQDDVFAVHLAMEEAFLNAVKHGNKMDPHKTVTIDYRVDPEKVDLRLTDQGEGFDPRTIPDPRVGENLFRPEGRGLLLMTAYMHLVEYNERGNGVHMIRYRNMAFPHPEGAATV
jgi:serine/threonine-protein kinase RsbW